MPGDWSAQSLADRCVVMALLALMVDSLFLDVVPYTQQPEALCAAVCNMIY